MALITLMRLVRILNLTRVIWCEFIAHVIAITGELMADIVINEFYYICDKKMFRF